MRRGRYGTYNPEQVPRQTLHSRRIAAEIQTAAAVAAEPADFLADVDLFLDSEGSGM